MAIEELVKSELSSVLVFIATFLLANRWSSGRRQASKSNPGGLPLPPALPWLPIVGSLPFMSTYVELHRWLLIKSKELGPVFSFYIGSNYAIVLNGSKAFREALVARGTDFADREGFFMEQQCNKDLLGIGSHPFAPRFQKYHRHASAYMKKFGHGPRLMEKHVKNELDDQFAMVRGLNGKEFDPQMMCLRISTNITAATVLGRRFELSDPRLDRIIQIVHDFTELVQPTLNLFPQLRILPKYSKCVDEFNECCRNLMNEASISMDESLASGEDNFVKSFYKADGKNFNRLEVQYVVRDLMVGGAETSAIQVSWGMIELANHPDIQAKMQAELDSVVPADRYPSLDDRPSLPYCDAVVTECFRRHSLVPLAIPHRTLRDTHVAGYFIPANTRVIANVLSTGMDPDEWTNPEEFRPERFLDETGTKVVDRDRVMNFSLGKRQCIGQPLARQEVFLVMASIFQNFDCRPPTYQKKIPMDSKVLNLEYPLPHKIRLIPRDRKLATTVA